MIAIQTVRRIAQVWLLLLVIGALQPSRPGPIYPVHRELHFVGFGGVALLLLFASSSRQQELQAAGAVYLVGFALEFLQHVFYRNAMEWSDVRDDALAVLGAMTVYYLFKEAVRRRPLSRRL